MPKRFVRMGVPASVWEAGEAVQAWHRRRHLALLSLLGREELERVGSILEVGCGAGFSARCYKDAGLLEGRRYLGIDIDEEALEIARRRMPGLEFRNVDVAREDFGGGFGLAIMDSVLEHLERPQNAMSRLHGALGAGGVLLVSVPFMEPAASKYALAGSHRLTGIDEAELERLFGGFFAAQVFMKYPVPELGREVGFGSLLFAKAVAKRG